jgi:hypothetical protein
MRVTIEHREETAGVTGSRRNYFVDCAVTFSEEERAVIKARDLYQHNFVLPAATPIPTKSEFYGYPVLRVVGRLMIVAGFFWGIVTAFQTNGSSLPGPIFFAGIGIEIFAWLKTRKVDKRLDQSEQRIMLRKLLNDGRFAVYAVDPGAAKIVEEQIRAGLASIKQTIQSSTEISSRQTFEL